jgi:hypothetical protein
MCSSRTKRVLLRNSSLNSGATFGSANYPFIWSQSQFSDYAFINQDCNSCIVKHFTWLRQGSLMYDSAITRAGGSSYSVRMIPQVPTFNACMSGTNLVIRSFVNNANPLAGQIAATQYLIGTSVLSGTQTNAIVTNQARYTAGPSQTFGRQDSSTTCSATVVVQAAALIDPGGGPPRLPSAPIGRGLQVAAANGTTPQVCVWVRPSISTDANPPYGSVAAQNYTGDVPRLQARSNPAMGVQSDTVLATLGSPTAGTWGQLCGTLPSAPMDGVFEVFVDVDETATSNPNGYVNITDWSIPGGANSNGNSQFWFNGMPFATPGHTEPRKRM